MSRSYHHPAPWAFAGIERRLDAILHLQHTMVRTLFTLLEKDTTIMALLTALEAEVMSMSGTISSAVELIKGLRQQIIDAGTDPVKLAELVDQLRMREADLAAAVATNPT